jgi:hypothetical protein
VFDGADVTLQVTATGGPRPTHQWQFNGEDLPGETNATLFLGDVDSYDAGGYKVVVSNYVDTATSDLATLTVLPVLTLKDALDAETLVWRTGGNQSWLPQTNTTHDTVDAAQSGTIGNNQLSWLETTVNGPGSIQFWWKVSSEPGFDKLRCLISGVDQARISGEQDWQQRTFSVSAGTQVLRWTYEKDGSGASGLDRGWLDQVVYSHDPSVAQPSYLSARRAFRYGQFRMTLVGETNRVYTIQSSTNLVNWADAFAITNVTGTVRFTTPANQNPTFYRARRLP